MGLERETQHKMTILTDTEMQQLAGGSDPVDSTPLPSTNQIGSGQLQITRLLNDLAQMQQAAYLRWLRFQAA